MKKIAVILLALVSLFGLTACAQATETYPLHALQLGNEQSSHGNFFLIAGGYGTNENAQYYFYVESPDGTLSLHKNKYEDIVIKLIPNGSDPFIRCTGDAAYINAGERYAFTGGETKDYCVFHVPEDSIKHDVDIDLENLKE